MKKRLRPKRTLAFLEVDLWAENHGFTLAAYPGHCLKTPSGDIIAVDAVLSQVLQPRAHVLVHFPGAVVQDLSVFDAFELNMLSNAK